MSDSKHLILKEVKLSNNCPECYSNSGLQLTFKQSFIENLLYKANTKAISKELNCTNCNTQIFPVRWTDDIELVVAYQERALKPKSRSLKLKPLAWVLILFDLILLVGIVLYTLGIITF